MNSASEKDKVPTRALRVWRKHGLKLLSIGAALVAFTVAYLVRSNAEQALQMAKAGYQQQQNTNRDAEQSAALLEKYIEPFKALQARQIIGLPQRLQWLETLQATATQLLIPKVDFVLSPTVVADSVVTVYLDDILAVKVTPMRIEFNLAHEGDFLRLVRQMRAKSKGLFSLQACEISRSEVQVSGDTNVKSEAISTGAFKGNCDLLWYSVADITAAWEAPLAP